MTRKWSRTWSRPSKTKVALAVVAALREELSALLASTSGVREVSCAGRTFYRGRLQDQEVTLVLSGIGKVAAAATAALCIDRFAARSMVFTGVAGGLAGPVQVGDVVVADALLQHDMDARPLFSRWEVPLSGKTRFETDAARSALLHQAAQEVLAQPQGARAAWGRRTSHRGLIVSGDVFVSSQAQSQALRQELPDALAVEMEGAAMAQVCADFGCPLSVVRTISDRADDVAHVDFARFLQDVAAELSRDIVLRALALGLR